MDYRRRMAIEADPQRRHSERNMMIYMQFLMYESARHATTKLIEFEPNLEESKINILCSELVVFHYLRKVFGADDYRGQRLRIRKYEDVVLETLRKTIRGQSDNWKKAQTTAKELLHRAKKYHFITRANYSLISAELDQSRMVSSLKAVDKVSDPFYANLWSSVRGLWLSLQSKLTSLLKGG
jgi:hypothetical protein